ncbi:hypothetical protein Patl1_03933 [Pistacia atlantica]|uniref:Uncharacterized protein n=1 Tax=Pistacia atlantica TaxID=434234 RepID=A0ACC1BQY8_9ROSI|nr:hypothetical protein Patl1_03933 [Pistacia atlantica]
MPRSLMMPKRPSRSVSPSTLASSLGKLMNVATVSNVRRSLPRM